MCPFMVTVHHQSASDDTCLTYSYTYCWTEQTNWIIHGNNLMLSRSTYNIERFLYWAEQCVIMYTNTRLCLPQLILLYQCYYFCEGLWRSKMYIILTNWLLEFSQLLYYFVQAYNSQNLFIIVPQSHHVSKNLDNCKSKNISGSFRVAWHLRTRTSSS